MLPGSTLVSLVPSAAGTVLLAEAPELQRCSVGLGHQRVCGPNSAAGPRLRCLDESVRTLLSRAHVLPAWGRCLLPLGQEGAGSARARAPGPRLRLYPRDSAVCLRLCWPALQRQQGFLSPHAGMTAEVTALL